MEKYKNKIIVSENSCDMLAKQSKAKILLVEDERIQKKKKI